MGTISLSSLLNCFRKLSFVFCHLSYVKEFSPKYGQNYGEYPLDNFSKACRSVNKEACDSVTN